MCVLFFNDTLRSVSLGLSRKTEELVCKQLSEHRSRCGHHVYHTGIVHLEVNCVCRRVDCTLPILSDVELFCNGTNMELKLADEGRFYALVHQVNITASLVHHCRNQPVHLCLILTLHANQSEPITNYVLLSKWHFFLFKSSSNFSTK